MLFISSGSPSQRRVSIPSSYSKTPSTHLSSPRSLFPSLEEIICNRFLRRHAPRILWRSLKNPISSSWPISRAGTTLSQSRAQSPIPIVAISGVDGLPVAGDVGSKDPASVSTGLVPVRTADEASVGAVFAELEDCSDVTAAVAIVGCRPDSYDSRLEHFFEAFHNQLMCSCNQT